MTHEAAAAARGGEGRSAESAPTLSPAQVHALFDILSHHETYAEIEAFKTPDAVTGYGFPFSRTTTTTTTTTGGGSKTGTPRTGTPRTRTPVPVDADDQADAEPSSSPILQALLARIVLPLPGARDLSRSFWATHVQGLLARLGDAGLSESYDKGAVGLRKVLATGAGSVLEMVGRGAFGGVPRRGEEEEGAAEAASRKQAAAAAAAAAASKGGYDSGKAEELERAWEDVMQGFVYGGFVDEVFDHAARTDDLEGLSDASKAAAEYAIIYLATFAHHVLIISPEGQYLLRLVENVHGLIPYKMLKQTLRVGNAATMISGMMRLLLAKLSVTSITNWVGLTNSADDGMNLLQRIISLTLSWDSSEFRKSADKIEKDSKPSGGGGGGDEALRLIREYVSEGGRLEQWAVRNGSAEAGKSIVTAILEKQGWDDPETLSNEDHAAYLAYHSALLSVRDREAITTALCRSPPDLFTAATRELISAYEPIIRDVHTSVDLREHLEAGQGFIDELIRASKPKKESGGAASVEEYVDLLMRNRGLMYKWVHALAAGCPGVWAQLRAWAKGVFGRFRKTGAEEQQLAALFEALPDGQQKKDVLAALDAHAGYLAELRRLSRTRLQKVVDARRAASARTTAAAGDMAGPGIYLSRWRDLLDETPITPAQPVGPVRTGRDVKGATTMGKVAEPVAEDARRRVEAEEPEAPDVRIVVRTMGEGFRRWLQEAGVDNTKTPE